MKAAQICITTEVSASISFEGMNLRKHERSVGKV